MRLPTKNITKVTLNPTCLEIKIQSLVYIAISIVEQLTQRYSFSLFRILLADIYLVNGGIKVSGRNAGAIWWQNAQLHK